MPPRVKGFVVGALCGAAIGGPAYALASSLTSPTPVTLHLNGSSVRSSALFSGSSVYVDAGGIDRLFHLRSKVDRGRTTVTFSAAPVVAKPPPGQATAVLTGLANEPYYSSGDALAWGWVVNNGKAFQQNALTVHGCGSLTAGDSCVATPMTMAGVVFQRGIAVAASENSCCPDPLDQNSATVKFALRRSWTKLDAKVGLDDAHNRQKVDVQFLADQKLVKEITLRAGDLRQAISLNVVGVRVLTMNVSNIAADGTGRAAQVDLVNPLLSR